jgi:uncharacterized membrane protein (UPF0127 family)
MRSCAAVLALALALGAACARQPQLAPAVGPREPRPGPRTLVALPAAAPRRASDGPTVYVEVSATQEARRAGLSGRDALPEDGGMLFAYPWEETRFYWMKGCRIGLDIAFLDEDGTILQVATLPPGEGRSGDEIPSVTSEHPVRYVRETAAGWLADHGLGVGDRVDLSAATEGVVPD